MEPENSTDKYAVCIEKNGNVVGHLSKGKYGRFSKTIFFFLRANEYGSCKVRINKSKAINGGDGMEIACTLAAVNLSKIYFLKNSKKRCKPNNRDLNRG